MAHFPGGKFRYFCQKCVSSPFFTLHCCIRTAGTEGSNYHLPAPNSFNSRGEVSPGGTVHMGICIVCVLGLLGPEKLNHFTLTYLSTSDTANAHFLSHSFLFPQPTSGFSGSFCYRIMSFSSTCVSVTNTKAGPVFANVVTRQTFPSHLNYLWAPG